MMRWARTLGGLLGFALFAGVGCARAAAATSGGLASPTEVGWHARPRALAVDARGDLLYVALSTADRVSVVDVSGPAPHAAAELRVCRFPDALAALPGGGVVVSCRFDPALTVVTRVADPVVARAPGAGFAIRAVDAGPEHGHQGIALDGDGRFAYVTSPALGGVKVVDLRGGGGPPRFFATGVFPKRIRFVPADVAAGQPRPLLLVANFVGHTVTVHDVADDGALSPARQTIVTDAPVMDMAAIPAGTFDGDRRGALLLLTHEDRPLSRARLSVEGLDSVVLVVPRAPSGALAPFADPGRGQRVAINLTERASDPLVELEALAIDSRAGRLAIVGGGTDNLLVAATSSLSPSSLIAAPVASVGANPTAVAFLPDGRAVTADRLSDTISFVDAPPSVSSTPTVRAVVVGRPDRPSPAERGELLFYSRALVPRNIADGPLSIYTCAACHADGHIDGRRHPSKRNRFYSMTKTCRGLAGTEPFLSLGMPDTFAAFADNIVATHAQGALDAPDTYDRYPVTLRTRTRSGRADVDVTLSPDDVRAALAAYMARIPIEPSPFVTPGRRDLTAAETRGLALFRESCSGCHQLIPSTSVPSPRPEPARALGARLLAGALALTSPRLYDVGTPVLGEGGNNPPSLRGVWAAAPYFSDGSAPTLADVLRRTNPASEKIHAAENASRTPAFSAAERDDLIALLRAL